MKKLFIASWCIIGVMFLALMCNLIIGKGDVSSEQSEEAALLTEKEAVEEDLGAQEETEKNSEVEDTKAEVSSQADEVVLTVGVGSGEGELGYSDTMKGGGSGPEAFTVTGDEMIYICDNMNKRVNVFENGAFAYEIETPYISYVRSMVVSQELIYLMDYDAGMIYELEAEGDVRREISLPEGMDKLSMEKLYVRGDGTVWLYNYHAGSYCVDDLADGKTDGIEGFTKDGNSVYRISEGCLIESSAEDTDNGNDYVSGTTENILLVEDASLASMGILNVDKNGSVYVNIYEMEDTSTVTGAYTVRKYANGNCEGTASIDLDSYYFMPNKVISVSEEGDLYQMICGENQIQIIKKAFVK